MQGRPSGKTPCALELPCGTTRHLLLSQVWQLALGEPMRALVRSCWRELRMSPGDRFLGHAQLTHTLLFAVVFSLSVAKPLRWVLSKATFRV